MKKESYLSGWTSGGVGFLLDVLYNPREVSKVSSCRLHFLKVI